MGVKEDLKRRPEKRAEQREQSRGSRTSRAEQSNVAEKQGSTSSRMLMCDYPVPLDRYDDRISVHWKFLPLLRDFGSIGQYCKRSACLAHLWHNWERGNQHFRYLTLAHFRKALDDLQESEFVWVVYAVDCVDSDIIPADIYMHSVVWSATVPLVSFECIEWHATDRYRRQFGFVQGVPHQERNLNKAHGEVLTGSKNLNWATATSHSFWVMQWTNRYNHVLTEFDGPQHPLDIYMHWYRTKYGNHLNLSDLVVQENDDGDLVMDDVVQENEETEEQEPQSPSPLALSPPPQELQRSSQYVTQTQFT
nr:uncharacterized protein LOC114925204 [Arachis hypogaea]